MSYFITPKGELLRDTQLVMKFPEELQFTTPKGEVVPISKLKEVKLPPIPDADKLKALGFRLKEQHPRVPNGNVDTWCNPEGVHIRIWPCISTSSYHGLRWIIEKIPEQVETPPEAMPESDSLPPMPVAPDGYEFRRVKQDIEGVLSVMDNDDSDEGVALDSIQRDPRYAGLFDEFGKHMLVDPMWRDKSGTRWSKYLRSRTPVRPAFVMFRKDGAE